MRFPARPPPLGHPRVGIEPTVSSIGWERADSFHKGIGTWEARCLWLLQDFYNGDTRMPHAPRRNCRQQGCRNLAEKGSCYCREHQLEQNRNYNRYERDPETQAFYTSKEWRSVRRYQLEHFPLCAECLKEGRYTPATLVDHIKPIREGGARLDMANLQSLCWSCHSQKSIEEGSRYGRRKSADED